MCPNSQNNDGDVIDMSGSVNFAISPVFLLQAAASYIVWFIYVIN